MIWLPVMFADELDMLRVRLDHISAWQLMADTGEVVHVIAEAGVTHKGVPKPLVFAENEGMIDMLGSHQYAHVIASLPDSPDPWVREHAQRDAAWPRIDAEAGDDDWVLIGDLDEIPSYGLLDELHDGTLPDPVAIRMRVFIHAVDWEVPQSALPPQCVAATAGYIRRHGGSLAAVRDARSAYPEYQGGGMHFSWLGTPGQQARKLHDKTCHTEILGTAEADLIESGARYRDGASAGGLPVMPVTVDSEWPLMIRERRCPENWFRP